MLKRFKNSRLRARVSSFSFEFSKTVIIALAAVLFIRTFITKPFLVSGSSMEPNFYNGDYLLVDELSYRVKKPERGEVIVFKYPGNPKSYYIKRIIGLPGERVVISGGVVTAIKGDKKIIVKEDYINPTRTFSNHEIELKDNEYFVMGDNRNFSYDSRNWGPLEENKITGVVRVRLWPILKTAIFGAPDYESEK